MAVPDTAFDTNNDNDNNNDKHVNDPYNLQVYDKLAINTKPNEDANIDELEEYEIVQKDDDNTTRIIEDNIDAASIGVASKNIEDGIQCPNSVDDNAERDINGIKK